MEAGYLSKKGSPLPLGATFTPHGVNFALFSRHAKAVSLVIFSGPADQAGSTPTEIALNPDTNKTGDIWHILLTGISEEISYAYRVDGPYDPEVSGDFFNPDHLLLDPYAKELTGGEEWATPGDSKNSFFRRCLAHEDTFDWEEDRPLNIPLKDSIIYEMHVRGFTRHPNSGVQYPGTFRGVVEKIPYLKTLGITAVELMPVTDFNELENTRLNPITNEPLTNFWGYSPLSFFSSKASYSFDRAPGGPIREFKEMVKALHRAGIEVILDVVFNHTAEGGGDGPLISFRGLDNSIYYLLDPQTREYRNYSGCGNTLNCNHPLVRKLIIDCLRYWVVEMHVDGFRFDLASILGRDQDGEPLSNPPMVEIIAEDPVLSNIKIIAEAWDAAGLYQVGSFSTSARWAEWNGHFRDDVRAFACGHEDTVAALATRIAGSADLYQRGSHQPCNSINFITSHDGFTLADLVSYNEKHNKVNGEDNRDGSDHNISWNSGCEGDTDNKSILALRARRVRTMAVVLFLSQGVPMLVAGDEFGRSQKGNNNAYCQDNDISWINWDLAEENKDLLRFFQELIALRKNHPIFRRDAFFSDENENEGQEILWQSDRPHRLDWSAEAKILAFLLRGESQDDTDFFVVLNGNRSKSKTVTAPRSASGSWRLIINTAAPSPGDIFPAGQGKTIRSDFKVTVKPMAAVVLIRQSTGQA